jgi:site-specific DNA recombinase
MPGSFAGWEVLFVPGRQGSGVQPWGMVADSVTQYGVAADAPGGGDALAVWAERTGRRQAAHRCGVLRFAFYWAGVDRGSSGSGYVACAATGAGRCAGGRARSDRGRVLRYRAEPRTLAWPRRPQTASLVAALADPGRGWDAIMIGEYERAFYGGQYSAMAPLFEHYGVQLWTRRSAGGSTSALRIMSRPCWPWVSIQAGDYPYQDPGPHGDGHPDPRARTLSRGRPPYGYRLADAGPHPNKAHAAWGRRAHRLEPDPDTALVVAWMFARRLAGHSIARITRALNWHGWTRPSPASTPHQCGADRLAG